jgi:Na+-translocating ferredoxin:NAD+ oxidoreductase RnfD subunit
MQKYRYIAMHAVVAAVFIFVLQHYAFGATFESSLLWAFVFSILAGGLASMQANR